MKLKLDENLGSRLVQLFQAAGHDAATVTGQRLAGIADFELIQRCRHEERAIITLDLDFGNPLLFRPSEHRGIAVLRPPQPTSHRDLEDLCQTLLGGLSHEKLDGRLWIIERGRIRIYQEEKRH